MGLRRHPLYIRAITMKWAESSNTKRLHNNNSTGAIAAVPRKPFHRRFVPVSLYCELECHNVIVIDKAKSHRFSCNPRRLLPLHMLSLLLRGQKKLLLLENYFFFFFSNFVAKARAIRCGRWFSLRVIHKNDLFKRKKKKNQVYFKIFRCLYVPDLIL